MRVSDIKKRLLEMTAEERRQFILDVRKDRRIQKETPAKKKAVVNKKSQLDKLLESLSDEDKQDLLAQLTESDDAG